jgi:hypothetical protein
MRALIDSSRIDPRQNAGMYRSAGSIQPFQNEKKVFAIDVE